jgi:uncharacterized membrane protein
MPESYLADHSSNNAILSNSWQQPTLLDHQMVVSVIFLGGLVVIVIGMRRVIVLFQMFVTLHINQIQIVNDPAA